jgi:NAD(P)-dependent dehydrogenase (short-subunit alcohol dehydrogenase family)
MNERETLIDKVVLITGSSTGFGKTTAKSLAQRGYRVIATMRNCSGRNSSVAEALRSLAESKGWSLDVIDMDVTSDASVNHAVEEALARAGRLDVVINNAGIAAVGITEAFTVEQFQQVFDVNLFGALRVNRAVLPAMRRQRNGLLIHVSSVGGRVVVPGLAPYHASKYALEAVADALRYELSEFSIDSVLVEPGSHSGTAINEKALALAPADQDRVAGYGSTAETVHRIGALLEQASRAPDTPTSEVVVDAFVRLIEMPAGERPFRTVPTVSMQPLLEPYNALAASIRDSVAEMFGISELKMLRG